MAISLRLPPRTAMPKKAPAPQQPITMRALITAPDVKLFFNAGILIAK